MFIQSEKEFGREKQWTTDMDGLQKLRWVKETSEKQYTLNDSIYIRCKLIYNDTKQLVVACVRSERRDQLQRITRDFWGAVLFCDTEIVSRVFRIDKTKNCTLQMNTFIAGKLFLKEIDEENNFLREWEKEISYIKQR